MGRRVYVQKDAVAECDGTIDNGADAGPVADRDPDDAKDCRDGGEEGDDREDDELHDGGPVVRHGCCECETSVGSWAKE